MSLNVQIELPICEGNEYVFLCPTSNPAHSFSEDRDSKLAP